MVNVNTLDDEVKMVMVELLTSRMILYHYESIRKYVVYGIGVLYCLNLCNII